MHDKFTVMIVEDDLLIADMMEDSLLMAGFNVCGIATNIAEGLALATEHVPELAVIDVRLAGGDLGTTLAMELKRRSKMLILYATGNTDFVLNDPIGEACITKPYSLDVLCQSLSVLGNMARNGVIGSPLPAGLILLGNS